ncbi:unnamed protein product [Rotaria socialis]
MSDYVAQAKEDRDNLNKQRRHRYQYRKQFSQEQVFEEYIDDFLSEQDSPLSQNNDDDSDIHGLLTNIVSRLALDIEEYKKLIFNPNQETKFDIPFAKVYQRLIQQHSTENLLTLLLHVDGIGLVKSSKLKLWICDASIIELPPELRYRRANVFLISVYIGYTEPNVNIWLKSSFHTLIELKKTG